MQWKSAGMAHAEWSKALLFSSMTHDDEDDLREDEDPDEADMEGDDDVDDEGDWAEQTPSRAPMLWIVVVGAVILAMLAWMFRVVF
jgi:hypothetical protein